MEENRNVKEILSTMMAKNSLAHNGISPPSPVIKRRSCHWKPADFNGMTAGMYDRLVSLQTRHRQQG